eukprot:c20547_g2_i1.p1 GENE.c20547_g2_i1~~c20547_g2_i1.p1  ORF type:complete len:188 (-),score=47.55 c20547_g2_i1:19-582(-)
MDSVVDDADVRCMFRLSKVREYFTPLAQPTEFSIQFDNLLGSGGNSNFRWREFSNFTNRCESLTPEHCHNTPLRFGAEILESAEKVREELVEFGWPSFSPRVTMLHTCPSRIGPLPHKLHSLCRASADGVDVNVEFEKYLLGNGDGELVDIEISGFGLESTVSETAADLLANAENVRIHLGISAKRN